MAKDKNCPDCFKCKHRGNIPGDCHIRCNHPSVKASGDNNPVSELMGIFASVGRVPPVIGGSKDVLNIRGNPGGINGGWFNWPYNFDPVWLENCDGFEANKSPND